MSVVSDGFGMPYLVDPGWQEIVLLGDRRLINGLPFVAMALIKYPDGRVAFRHFCDRGERGQVICAPYLRLGEGHTLVSWNPATVTPSILCPDCNTHGFVTNGRWLGV